MYPRTFKVDEGSQKHFRMMLRIIPAFVVALLGLLQPCPAPWLVAGAAAAAEAAATAAAALSSETAAGIFQIGGSIAKTGGQIAGGLYGQNRWKLETPEVLSSSLDRMADALQLSPSEGAELKDAIYGWSGKDGISLMRFFKDVADMQWTKAQAQVDEALAAGTLDQQGHDTLDYLFYVPPSML